MIKKLKSTDILFIISVLLVLLLHIFFFFLVPYLHDESYYVTVPFRLVNGDSLVQHEWHLTQFSTLFSYLPVYIWTLIKGSVDGVFIFTRCVYLLIHTSIAVVIYRFFRKYGKWAVMASIIFYVQVPYRIQAISYQSIFTVFLLLLSLCILSIYEKNSVHLYIFAGFCFGCCCVCNPLFCFAFAIYLISCVLWSKRQIFISKVSNASKKGKKLTNKQKREQKRLLLEKYPNMDSYSCFFTKEAVLWITCGIVIIGVIAAAFFFLTGGTIDSIFDNIENLLGSSEYDVASKSFFSKLVDTVKYFSIANFGMPWILPALFISLLLDGKKKCNKHRLIYLSVSVLWAILFMFGVITNIETFLCAISLPFCVFSTVCYLLTENKNKTLFYCMHIPCLIATSFQYLAADTHWATIGIVLAVNNVAGVFFAMDLWKEMRSVSKTDSETNDDKKKSSLCHGIIIISFCLQILFYCIFYQFAQLPIENATKATTGPYSGLYMSEEKYNSYNKAISDMDYIKELSRENDPVLLASYNNWMYLYLERPMATYTAWYRGSLNTDLLISYYEENPEKIPKYIYVESSDPKNANVDIVSKLFDFTREDLSNGVLLTVEYCNF